MWQAFHYGGAGGCRLLQKSAGGAQEDQRSEPVMTQMVCLPWTAHSTINKNGLGDARGSFILYRLRLFYVVFSWSYNTINTAYYIPMLGGAWSTSEFELTYGDMITYLKMSICSWKCGLLIKTMRFKTWRRMALPKTSQYKMNPNSVKHSLVSIYLNVLPENTKTHQYLQCGAP